MREGEGMISRDSINETKQLTFHCFHITKL